MGENICMPFPIIISTLKVCINSLQDWLNEYLYHVWFYANCEEVQDMNSIIENGVKYVCSVFVSLNNTFTIRWRKKY